MLTIHEEWRVTIGKGFPSVVTSSEPIYFTTTPRRGLHTEQFTKPVASYSQGFQVGQMVFITGQLPVDPATGEKVGEETSPWRLGRHYVTS